MERKWSTPTVSDYGISGAYKTSTQKRYLVKCRHCGYEHAPDTLTALRIPGFDETFIKFDKEDLHSARYKVAQAYLACERCNMELDSSLREASRRRWVAEYLARDVTGYAVKPYDLIKYNDTPKVVKQLGKYHRIQDFYNFVLGEVYESNENQVNTEVVRNNTKINEQSSGNGCYLGVDVGKTCHYLVGNRVDGKNHVLKAGKLKQDSVKSMQQQIGDIYRQYNCYRGVIDAGPDFTLGQELCKEFGEYFHQCVYVRGSARQPRYYEVAGDTNLITAARTKAFDTLVAEINVGKWIWPHHEEVEELYTQLHGMKRIEQYNEEGEMVAKWVKVNDFDHYLHAAMYLKLAFDIEENPESGASETTASPAIITGVTVAKAVEARAEMSTREIIALYRVR
jgi:hypothetical protein